MKSYEPVLAECRELFEAILGDQLVGIYVHGSIAFHCFNWEKSDIDFLVVVKEPMTSDEKLLVMNRLYAVNEHAPEKGIEMSIMLLKDTLHFHHPAHYELHYSNGHKEHYCPDPVEYCRTMNGEDPDLAAHCTVIRAVGYPICGAPVEEVFGPVAAEDYLDSIWSDVENAEEDVLDNPVYVILNLCRVLAYVKENLVLSKEQGGNWMLEQGIESVLADGEQAAVYAVLIKHALACYASDAVMEPDERISQAFCHDMLKHICGERSRNQK